ncbi:LysM repeat protein [Desulfohalotomaculum tongense]|uniref:L,D-transpeptidase family protein n=1 Tax=Desulforadius tongensis TaxID=1216062 RepID=UPI00195AD243|nr:L,D-transpeptidase family protein [Desulforadius tongensis]MBM7855199.1 LysM repeat protein [Desulforadius tongensis]
MINKNITATKYLLVNTAMKKIEFYQGSRLVKSYPAAVGKPTTPTPTGQYKVATKIYHPGKELGTRWIGLSIPDGNYGIHGTNKPSSIGKAVSNGCIRMYNKDIEELFPRVNIGTPVIITASAEYTAPGKKHTSAGYQQEPDSKDQPPPAEAPEPAVENTWETAEKHPEYPEYDTALPTEETQTEKQPESKETGQTPVEGFEYIVKPGDTLWSIARSHGLPIRQLIEANNLENPNWLYPGQKIFIPRKKTF